MQAKLTLRLDESLIDRAKAYSRESGKSLSRIVADYFALLTRDEPLERDSRSREELPPITRSLVGALKSRSRDEDLDIEDEYHRYLEEKHLDASSPMDRELVELAASGTVRLGKGALPPEFWDLPHPEDAEAKIRSAVLDERSGGK